MFLEVAYPKDTPSCCILYAKLNSRWGIEGSNFIRYNLDYGKINIQELERSIRYAEEKGIYVLISPCCKNGTMINMPNQESHDYIINMARQFSDYNNVMLEVLNEIGSNFDNSDDSWCDLVVSEAHAIRKANPNVLIVLPGGFYNKWFGGYLKRDLSFGNFAFDLHWYQYKFKTGQEVTERYTDYKTILGKYPVMITEAGVSGGNGGKTNPDDAVYVQKALDLADAYPKMVHWAAYEAGPPPSWSTSIMDSFTSIGGPRGNLYTRNLMNPASTPPSNFRK